ncbi:hypothetical protein [Nonomuraea sp. NPDC048916]|uniref:AraC-like ligand-binding domain-containing protein n=1 Tax=Nonomuraea sp. NPDC048916 TaxID=3154232 RepID=UPI0033DE0DD7
MIRQSDPELYQLSLNLRGRSGVSQGRQDVCLSRMEMVLYDSSRPFDGRAVPEGSFAEECWWRSPGLCCRCPAAGCTG